MEVEEGTGVESRLGQEEDGGGDEETDLSTDDVHCLRIGSVAMGMAREGVWFTDGLECDVTLLRPVMKWITFLATVLTSRVWEDGKTHLQR